MFPSSSLEESLVVAETSKKTGKDTYGKKPQFCSMFFFFFKKANQFKCQMSIIAIIV